MSVLEISCHGKVDVQISIFLRTLWLTSSCFTFETAVDNSTIISPEGLYLVWCFWFQLGKIMWHQTSTCQNKNNKLLLPLNTGAKSLKHFSKWSYSKWQVYHHNYCIFLLCFLITFKNIFSDWLLYWVTCLPSINFLWGNGT